MIYYDEVYCTRSRTPRARAAFVRCQREAIQRAEKCFLSGTIFYRKAVTIESLGFMPAFNAAVSFSIARHFFRASAYGSSPVGERGLFELIRCRIRRPDVCDISVYPSAVGEPLELYNKFIRACISGALTVVHHPLR